MWLSVIKGDYLCINISMDWSLGKVLRVFQQIRLKHFLKMLEGKEYAILAEREIHLDISKLNLGIYSLGSEQNDGYGTCDF
jgi:hypothetical protein